MYYPLTSGATVDLLILFRERLMATPRTMFEKIWSRHVVAEGPGGHVLLYVDRHLLRSEEHTSELQSHLNLVCRLLLEKKKSYIDVNSHTLTSHLVTPRIP